MENNYHDPAQRVPNQPQQANQQQTTPALPNQTPPPQPPPQQQPQQFPQQAQQQPPQAQYQQPPAQYQQPQQQYQPPQQQYQPPNQQQNYNTPKLYPSITIGEWIGVIIVMAIPLINFIMLLVWGFGNGNPSKANWAKATLLIGIIGGVLASIIYLVVFLVAGLALN